MCSKIPCFAAMFLLVACLLASASPPAVRADSNSEVIIGATEAFAPISFLVQGHLTGFATDVSSAVARQLGMKPVFWHSESWLQVLGWMADGKVQLINVASRSKERESEFEFSDPVIELPERIFVRTGRKDLTTLESLAGKRVAAITRHITQEMLSTRPEIKQVLTSSLADALLMLRQGNVDALVYPEQPVQYLLKELRIGDSIEAVGDPVRVLQSCIVARKGELELISKVNKALRDLRSSGELAQLEKRWFEKSVFDDYTDAQILVGAFALATLALLGGVAAAMWISNRRLARRVESEIASRMDAQKSQIETDRKLRLAEASTERFFELSLDPLCIASMEGVFRRLNPGWMTLLGYSPKELVGRPYMEFVHPDDITRTREVTAKLKLGESVAGYQNRYICKDGTWKHLSWSAVGVPEDDAVYASARDVTALKQAQDLLEESAKELALRNADLARSNTELEQFAYAASHDLQEPLRKISGFLTLLNERYKGRLAEDADEFIGYTLDATKRMKTMIEGLLEYSRVSSSGEPFTFVDLNEAAKVSVSDLQVALEESKADVQWERLPVVMADKTQIEQLLRNLVGNAVKYRAEAAPKVRLFAKSSNDEWIIGVEDNGIGIDPQHLDRIFRVFQRLHSVSKYPGSGIGLALCRKIVERHGGRIWVESEPGKGSTFYFAIPKSDKGADHDQTASRVD